MEKKIVEIDDKKYVFKGNVIDDTLKCEFKTEFTCAQIPELVEHVLLKRIAIGCESVECSIRVNKPNRRGQSDVVFIVDNGRCL